MPTLEMPSERLKSAFLDMAAEFNEHGNPRYVRDGGIVRPSFPELEMKPRGRLHPYAQSSRRARRGDVDHCSRCGG